MISEQDAALYAANPWLGAANTGLKMLSSFFGGRAERREAEKDRELRRQQLGLEKSRFGLEKQRYGDEMAARRRLAEFARQNRAKLEGGSVSGGAATVAAVDPLLDCEPNSNRSSGSSGVISTMS